MHPVSHDDFLGHELSGCTGKEFFESLFVLFEVAIVYVGSQEVDVLRDMGLDFFIQEVSVGDNPDDGIVIVYDGDSRYVVFDEHIDEIKNRRIFFAVMTFFP